MTRVGISWCDGGYICGIVTICGRPYPFAFRPEVLDAKPSCVATVYRKIPTLALVRRGITLNGKYSESVRSTAPEPGDVHGKQHGNHAHAITTTASRWSTEKSHRLPYCKWKVLGSVRPCLNHDHATFHRRIPCFPSNPVNFNLLTHDRPKISCHKSHRGFPLWYPVMQKILSRHPSSA